MTSRNGEHEKRPCLLATGKAGLRLRSLSAMVRVSIIMTEEDVKNALRTVKYPGYSRDIVSFGLIKQISANEGAVSVSMQLTSGTPAVVQQIKAESERALKALPGVNLVHVDVKAPTGGAPGAAPASPWQNQSKVSGIKRIVAVASGKGG